MGCLRLEYLEFTALRTEKNEIFARGKNEVGLIVAGLNHAMHGGFSKKYDVNVLHDDGGANGMGHEAMAFENEDGSLRYISKDGTDENGGISGKSKYTDKNFNSINEINDYYGKNVSPGKRYDAVSVFKATRAQINRGIATALAYAKGPYDLLTSSCTTLVEQSMQSMYKAKVYSGLSVPNLNFYLNNFFYRDYRSHGYRIK